LSAPSFLSADRGGVRVVLRVTPSAGRSGIFGPVDIGEGRTALAVKVAAPPVEGAANEALIALLAKELGVARSAVSLVSGAASRLKIVRVADCPLPKAAAWAARWPG
jgi:uncharacterized protein (TIGR00251 family)